MRKKGPKREYYQRASKGERAHVPDREKKEKTQKCRSREVSGSYEEISGEPSAKGRRVPVRRPGKKKGTHRVSPQKKAKKKGT